MYPGVTSWDYDDPDVFIRSASSLIEGRGGVGRVAAAWPGGWGDDGEGFGTKGQETIVRWRLR